MIKLRVLYPPLLGRYIFFSFFFFCFCVWILCLENLEVVGFLLLLWLGWGSVTCIYIDEKRDMLGTFAIRVVHVTSPHHTFVLSLPNLSDASFFIPPSLSHSHSLFIISHSFLFFFFPFLASPYYFSSDPFYIFSVFSFMLSNDDIFF